MAGVIAILRREPSAWLTAAALIGLLAGVACWLGSVGAAADLAWGLTAAIAIPPMILALVADARQRKVGLDLIALLALAGALIYHQFLAGTLIALMVYSFERIGQRSAWRSRMSTRRTRGYGCG